MTFRNHVVQALMSTFMAYDFIFFYCMTFAFSVIPPLFPSNIFSPLFFSSVLDPQSPARSTLQMWKYNPVLALKSDVEM